MYLSMWIIKEQLKEYEVEEHIIAGEMNIRNVSLLFQRGEVNTHTAYVCFSEDFIPTLKGKILCINRNDYIVISSDSLEEIFDKIVSIIDFYLEWDLEVRDSIESHCSLEEILKIGADILKKMICIVNPGFIIQDIAGVEYMKLPEEYLQYMKVGSGMPVEHITLYMKAYKELIPEKSIYMYEDPILKDKGLFQNLYFNGKFWEAVMLYIQKSKITKGREQLFSVLNDQIRIWIERYGIESEFLEQERILLDILNNKSNQKSEKIWTFFNRVEWYEDDKKYLILCKEKTDNEIIYSRIRHEVSLLYPYCYAVKYDGYSVLILNESNISIESFIENLRPLFDYGSVVIGISFPFQDILSLSVPIEQAKIAFEFGIRIDKSVNYCKEYILRYTRLLLKDEDKINLCHPLLDKIHEYDQLHNTQYYKTLNTYLLKERNLVKTSKELKIHINTLKYRINRMKEIFNMELDADSI